MDKIPKEKLTENKSNQINFCDSFDSIYSQRKTIKIKSKEKSFLTEEKNSIKNIKSKNYILFPKIKNDLINNIKQSPRNLSINNSYMNNIHTLDKSNSNKIRLIKNPNYIGLNSLFFFPKEQTKRNNPNKIYYSNSIDVPKSRRLKLLKLNILQNNNSKIHPLKIGENKKSDELYDIKNFMKKKYYEDTKAKMERELKDDSFVDRRDKDKLIKIGKFHVFWKNVIDYCGGYIFSQRMKIEYFSIKNNSTDEKNNKMKLKKAANNRIYTSILKSKLIHYKNNL